MVNPNLAGNQLEISHKFMDRSTIKIQSTHWCNWPRELREWEAANILIKLAGSIPVLLKSIGAHEELLERKSLAEKLDGGDMWRKTGKYVKKAPEQTRKLPFD